MMIDKYKLGAIELFLKKVEIEDIAKFESGVVHEVYSTFALVRDAEWSGRLFVLGLKEEDEEGIGAGITVKHISPAFVGDEVLFTSRLEEINGNEVVSSYKAEVGNRLIAEGIQKQRILKKDKIDTLFSSLKS